MAATIAAADTIEGGGGTDTIAITGAATAAEAANVTGFEVLDVTGDFTQDASVVAGITSLVANAAGAAHDTVAFTNASATQTLNVRSVDSADDDVSLALATDTPSDTATVTLGTATAGVTFDDLTLNDAETINIANNGGTSAIAELISGDATSVVATGSEQLTMTAFTAANIATVDASAMTGDFIMGAAASNQDSTITGGSGDNTLIGGTGDDNITGGSGENTITAGTGDDTVTGGASDDTINEVEGDDSIDAAGGDDTIIISTFTDLTSDDVINGGDGDDTIDFQEDANHDFTNDTTIVSGISNIETLQFSDLTGADDTVTINDAVISNQAITLAATGNTTGATFDASGVLSSTTTVTFNDTSANDNTYSVGNAVDVVNMGAGNDTVTVGTTAFLGGSDAINGGAGTDTITFTNTADATISAAQLGAIENVETVAINTGGGGNYTLALTDTIVGAQVSAGETFTVSRTDADTGTTSVDGSAVTDTFNLSLDGGAGADTLTGGAGDDTLDGNEGVDVLDLSAGGTDTVTIESEAAANGVTLTGFTTRGTGTTADAEADVLQIDESEINGGGFAPAGTGVGTLVAADFAEVDLAAGGTLTLQDNHVNVIAGKGFNDLDGVIADGSITAGGNGEEAFILFYNLSTQRAEMFYDTDISDGNTGAELVASFTDIDLTGMAGFDSTNFEIA
jgi:Ca2+-binding RTX toxin-like protein